MPDGQMPGPQPQLMLSQSGVQRDGTQFSQVNYNATEWCRFYQKLPRKMLGYREQRRDMNGIVRQLDVQSYDGLTYVHAGEQQTLQRYTVDINSGVVSGLVDRTPAGFIPSPNNNWQFALVYNTATNANVLLAHAVPNIHDIANTTERPVYIGEARDDTPLVPIDGSEMSGGILAMWPYFLRYGNDGEVAWCAPGELTNMDGTGSGSARPWGTKVVKGLPLRGTSGPAALLWHLDALTRCQFVGGLEVFRFDTLTTSTAIMSANAVIEHAGIYYWMTVSGFSTFNGVVRDMDNSWNRQFLLNNLNWVQRQKVFAFKQPRWHEIWWCVPLFGSAECNWAIIHNYVTGEWYDTPLPRAGRGLSAAVYEQIYHFPIASSPAINEETGGTSMWQHDFGFDEVSGPQATAKAIRSFYCTHEFNTVNPVQPGRLGSNQTMSFSIIEPDFNQQGDLEIWLLCRANARSNVRRKGPIIVPAVPKGNEQTSKTKFTGRLTAFLVVSNTLGGYYEAGAPLMHWQPAGGRTEDGGDEPTAEHGPMIEGDQPMALEVKPDVLIS